MASILGRTRDALQPVGRPLIKLWWMVPILAVIGIFMWFTGRLPQPIANDLGQAGQFGDSFGAVTSLFTGLGVDFHLKVVH